MNGSSTTSPLNVYNSIKRYGSSTGNGAGCPTLRADSAEKSQTDFVYSRNCSLEIVLLRATSPASGLACPRWNEPLEKTRMYSWISRRVGFAADCQEPHAVEALAEAPLSQMISPRIRKRRSSRSRIR